MAPRFKVPRFRTLLACAIVVATATVLARGIVAWTLRSYSIAIASRDVGHVASILAKTTARLIVPLDQSLARLKQDMVERRASSQESARLPKEADFAITDAQGHVVEHSALWPDAENDLSGRDFFAAAKASDAGLTISPIETRGSTSALILSRRAQSSRGEFLGVAVIRVARAYFAPIHSAIADMDDVSFTLRRADGTPLLRDPMPAEENAARKARVRLPPQPPWHAIAQGTGFYREDDDFDHQARLVAVNAVPDYPLMVDVGEHESLVLAPWQRLAAMIAGVTLISLICFGFLVWVLRVQFRNLSAAHASLAEREGELHRQSRALASAHAQIDAALNNMSQGLCMFDKDGLLLVHNERYLSIYGLPSDAVRPGTSFVDLLRYQQQAGNFSDDPLAFSDDLRARLARGEAIDTTHALANGRIIEIANEPMADGGWVATYDDITERQRSEARIARMARYDSLTDLANRMLFREKADAALESYRKTGIGYSIFIFDLDLFKSVNDSLGHPVGDALLKAVATRLQDLAGEADTVGRLGGDEFAILRIAAGEQRADAEHLARRLLAVIGAPYEIDGHNIVIGTSVGIAMAPHHGSGNEMLLKNADLALYRAKSNGRNSYRFFEAEMDREVQLRRTLEVDLNCAVANGEFEAHYQPLVNAEDGRICAVEALIRWHHPRHGMVGPNRFIPVAEESGLITAIDRWMLHRACRDATAWPADVRVAVNISPIEFRSGDLVEMIKEALEQSGLPATRLDLEITESVLLQKSERNLSILHRIKRLGVSIVLDDFGTGYSSLGYLRLFPFDKIKVDQSFVREMPYRTDCAAIVCAIANLGRELGIVTVAEGVETAEQLDLVRAAGCRQAQGFLFSRPVTAAQLTFDEEPRRALSA